MSIGKPAPKKAVALICSAFAQAQLREGGLRMKDAYNLLATLEGFKSWSHYKGHLRTQANEASAPAYGVVKASVESWPRFVFFDGYDEGGEDVQFMLPPGSTFDNRMNTSAAWKPFRDEGAKLVPDILAELSEKQRDEVRRNSFVVTQTFVKIPRIDRYGVPDFATAVGVGVFLEEAYGFNYVVYAQGDPRKQCAVEVHVQESGDDSTGQFWCELAIEPSLAAKLVEMFEQAPLPDWLD